MTVLAYGSTLRSSNFPESSSYWAEEAHIRGDFY
jgi:hypothetical protein